MNHIVRKLVFFLTFACLIGASAPASFAAQVITREDIENRRQEIVVATMKFGDEQTKQKFLEVYVPYQQKLMKIMKGREQLLTRFLQEEKNGAVSDAEASQILGKSLAFGEQRLEAEKVRRPAQEHIACRAGAPSLPNRNQAQRSVPGRDVRHSTAGALKGHQRKGTSA